MQPAGMDTEASRWCRAELFYILDTLHPLLSVWDCWGLHYSIGLHENPSELPPTDVATACHMTGEQLRFRLSGGAIVWASHPSAIVCFTAPMREWYGNLVDT